MNMILKLVKLTMVLIVVILITAIVFINVFDPNQYKPEIIEQVKITTGRNFNIEGDIELTLFPWVGLSLGKVTLGNAKGFSQNDFAALQQLNVKINVLPLLASRVEISKIQIHGLKLSLEVDKSANNNWQELVAGGKAETKTKTQDTKTTGKDSAIPLESLNIEGIEFLGAAISYSDNTTSTQSTISELDLKTSKIEFDTPVDLKSHARVEHNQPALDASVDLSTSLTFNKEFSVFGLHKLLLNVAIKANDRVKQDIALSLESQARVNLDSQVAEIKTLRLKAFDVTTNAEITIKELLKAPAISGTVSVEKFNAVSLTKKLGITLPAMANRDALSSVALSTKLNMLGQRLDLDAISIQLDDSKLTGWVHVLDIATMKLRYELALNQINLNDYMPPEQADTTKATDTTKVAEDINIELPIELLNKLDLESVFTINALHILDYDISKLSITTKARNGIINIAPVSLDILEGKVTAELNLNVAKKLPAYTINMNASEIHAGPVVNPFLSKISTEKPMKLKGEANVTVAVKTQGKSLNGLKQAADGNITLKMNKTEIAGFDPEYLLRSSVSDYLMKKGLRSGPSNLSDYKPREVTAFEIISDTAIIKDGKIQTSDFLMDSNRMTIKAKGFADIMQNSMDVTSSLQLKRGKASAEKILDEPLHVRAHGPFSQLKFSIDTSAVAAIVSNQLKDKIKAETQQKIEAEKQHAKDKLKDKLRNKLKGLF